MKARHLKILYFKDIFGLILLLIITTLPVYLSYLDRSLDEVFSEYVMATTELNSARSDMDVYEGDRKLQISNLMNCVSRTNVNCEYQASLLMAEEDIKKTGSERLKKAESQFGQMSSNYAVRKNEHSNSTFWISIFFYTCILLLFLNYLIDFITGPRQNNQR